MTSYTGRRPLLRRKVGREARGPGGPVHAHLLEGQGVGTMGRDAPPAGTGGKSTHAKYARKL